LRASELAVLKARADSERLNGLDVLARMAERLDEQIVQLRQKRDALRSRRDCRQVNFAFAPPFIGAFKANLFGGIEDDVVPLPILFSGMATRPRAQRRADR
jgi:hypothetical protein